MFAMEITIKELLPRIYKEQTIIKKKNEQK